MISRPDGDRLPREASPKRRREVRTIAREEGGDRSITWARRYRVSRVIDDVMYTRSKSSAPSPLDVKLAAVGGLKIPSDHRRASQYRMIAVSICPIFAPLSRRVLREKCINACLYTLHSKNSQPCRQARLFLFRFIFLMSLCHRVNWKIAIEASRPNLKFFCWFDTNISGCVLYATISFHSYAFYS